MSTPDVKTGDDWEIPITLKRGGTAYDVSAATDITCLVASTDDDDATILIAEATQSAGATGADWANGVVVVEFAAANTGISTYGRAYVEIQVTLGGKKLGWPRFPINIKKGLIV